MIEAQNDFLEHWETTWAAQRIYGSTRRQVEAMFQEERRSLKSLPLDAFQYFTECERTVCDDSCVRIDQSSYAARPARIGSLVLVRQFDDHIEIRDLQSQALLRTHERAARPGSVVLPDDEHPFNPSRETRCILAQAKAIGPSAEQLGPKWQRNLVRKSIDGRIKNCRTPLSAPLMAQTTWEAQQCWGLIVSSDYSAPGQKSCLRCVIASAPNFPHNIANYSKSATRPLRFIEYSRISNVTK